MSSNGTITLANVAGKQARVCIDALEFTGVNETVALANAMTRQRAWYEGGSYNLTPRDVSVAAAALSVYMTFQAQVGDVRGWYESRDTYNLLLGTVTHAN